MDIISFGYRLPNISDKNFWDTYNFDISRLSTHNHDGINSALLSAGHMQPTMILIETGDWVGPTDEVYSFQIPLPVNVTWPANDVSPIVIQMFEGGSSVAANFRRVDDDNLEIVSRTNTQMIVGLY